MQEVPTDDLLSFQDYPIAVHSPSNNTTSGFSSASNLTSNYPAQNLPQFDNTGAGDAPAGLHDDNSGRLSIHYLILCCENRSVNDLHISDTAGNKSFWTFEYYQQFFDVETKDVVDRIIASVVPTRSDALKTVTKTKPDLYGPFWISVTLVFTIAITGNIANYLQYANENYHWKYDFHLVSYAATAICIYVTLVPLCLWGLLKWSSDIADLDGLEDGRTPSALELICVYGYSLFIYIPVSILWSIQVAWLQWLLVLLAALLSGSVLLTALMPPLRLSRHKFLLIVGIISCHLLLAAGFMLFFFHVPKATKQVVTAISANHTKV